MKYYDKISFLNILSQNVKKFREINNLTQKELSKGICSQAQISNLENCIDVPSTFISYNICKRLGISLELLMEESTSEYYKKVLEIDDLIEICIESYDNEGLQKIATENREILLGGNNESRILYYYTKIATVVSNGYKSASFSKSDIDYVYKKYDQIMKLKIEDYNYLEFRVNNLMLALNIRMLNHNESASFIYKNLELISKINERKYYKRIIAFYINVGMVNNYIGDYKLASFYADKVISLCKKHKTAFGLDSAYIITGYQYNPLRGTGDKDSIVNIDLADVYYNKAIHICELFDNHKKAEYYRSQMRSNKKNSGQ